MARVEIYARFKSSGKWKRVGVADNAHRGAKLVWNKLEEKYLQSYRKSAPKELEPFIAGYSQGDNTRYIHRMDCYGITSSCNPCDEVWFMDENPNIDISYEDAITLRSTLDGAIVYADDALVFADCLIKSNEYIDGNLNEQADVIKTTFAEYSDDIEAFWILGTSINSPYDFLGMNLDKAITDDYFWNIMQSCDEFIEWRKSLK